MSSNRQLTAKEREQIFAPLFKKVGELLENATRGNRELLFALRRKLVKDLGYLERGTPMERRKLKEYKRKEQHNHCARCKKKLPKRGAILDRFEAMAGYTKENTQLLCSKCDATIQRGRRYK